MLFAARVTCVGRPVLKRRVSLLLFVSAVLLALTAPQPSSATPAGTNRVSVAGDGLESNGWSTFPAMSSDGRFAAFYSEATNLVIGDNALCDMDFDGIRNENCNDVFLHDLDTGATELVSLNSDEVQADDGSARPSISADGRFVTFLSIASNLVSGDTNNENDVFIRDRVLGVTERVSVDSNEAQGARHGEAAVNADGRFVAFESCGLSPLGETGVCAIGGSSARSHIYLRDRQEGTTTRVSVDSQGMDGNGDSFDPDISDDGRYVTFYSRASNLVANDTNTCVEFPPVGMCEDVFVNDRVTGTTERVSVADSGTQGDRPARSPSISGDGRFVTFTSWATNLVPGDTNSMGDIFLKDRLAGTLRRVSLSDAGGQLDGPSYESSLSENGRYLGFMSGATNVVPNDTNHCGSDVPPSCTDVFVQDTLTGMTVRTSVSSTGDQSPADSASPSISGDGGMVVFESGAPNLVPEDSNNLPDIFIRRLGDTDSDGVWDPFDLTTDSDGDSVLNPVESRCGSNPLTAASLPERIDTAADDDGDTEVNEALPAGSGPYDCDGDGFSGALEQHVFSAANTANDQKKCGVDAWPADMNNSGFSDISDIILLMPRFGEAVPPAPVRYDIAPEPPKPPGQRFIDISDIVRLTGVFGQGCS